MDDEVSQSIFFYILSSDVSRWHNADSSVSSIGLKANPVPPYSLRRAFVSPVFLIFVQFLFDLLIIITRVQKVFFVTIQNVLDMLVKIIWGKHRRKNTKPNEWEGTQCTSLTRTLKVYNCHLICGQLRP